MADSPNDEAAASASRRWSVSGEYIPRLRHAAFIDRLLCSVRRPVAAKSIPDMWAQRETGLRLGPDDLAEGHAWCVDPH